MSAIFRKLNLKGDGAVHVSPGPPAVATAVIRGPMKNAYNDAGPAEDIAGVFVPEIVAELTNLHNALADDLIALGLKVCST